MGDYDIVERMGIVRDTIERAKQDITKVCEPGHEVVRAMDKLDEARLWALESLASQATTIVR